MKNCAMTTTRKNFRLRHLRRGFQCVVLKLPNCADDSQNSSYRRVTKMKTTLENIAEARRAVAQYLELQRERQGGGRGDAGATFTNKAEPEHDFDTDAQRKAAEWANARNKNLRPLRETDETDENV